MRYMAIDIGGKRTGLAIGDDGSRIATPLGVIETNSGPERLRQLKMHIEKQGPDALVIGLPVNMDGTHGDAAKMVLALGNEWAKHFKLPVHWMDERLTSFAADGHMSQSGLSHGQKKSRRDALAAMTILKDFFEMKKAE